MINILRKQKVISYCSLLKPTLTQTQVHKILLFDGRVKGIIQYNQFLKKQVNLVYIRKRKICSFVNKVVMKEVDDPFENYFEFLNTTVNTRRKNSISSSSVKARIWSQVNKVSWSKNIY